MTNTTEPQWLNKRQVCQRLGNIGTTTLNYLIEYNGFPQGFQADTINFNKWYLPSIIEWEEKICNSHCRKMMSEVKKQDSETVTEPESEKKATLMGKVVTMSKAQTTP